MGAERWDEQVGTVADEAGRLLESLRRSAADAAAHRSAEGAKDDGHDGPDDAGSGSEPGPPGGAAPADAVPGARPDAGSGPDAAAHDPFCTWCPLCRSAAVIRTLSPETLARLADLASLAATVLTDLASSRPASTPPATDPATDPAGGDPENARHAPRPRPATRQHRATPARPIPVHDADDPQEAPRG